MKRLAQKPIQRQQKSSANVARQNSLASSGSQVHPLLHLQRTIGNQAVLRLQQAAGFHAFEDGSDIETGSSPEVRSATQITNRFAHTFSRVPVHAYTTTTLEPKLSLSTPGDSYEREADRVSEQIMRMPMRGVQPKCACGGKSTEECEGCGDTGLSVQRRSIDGGGPVADDFAAPIVHHTLRSPGRSLDTQTRALMEPHFGHDFSRVRIHADAGASHAADAVQAQAFTFGRDIVFGSGKFAPSTPAGLKLLAHELTHVVQQGAASAAATHSPGDLRTKRVSGPGRLQLKPNDAKDSPKTETCPPLEADERKESAKAQLSLVERIPQQEWLIYGFPIGGSEISGAEAGKFISQIVKSMMQGHFIYMTGEDPLEVIGFTDCVTGPRVDNQAIRRLRAAKFCAGVKDYYVDTPKTYPALIRSCGPAPMDQYVGSNASRVDRAQNRSILIRRLPAEKVHFQEGKETFPYNPKYGPSAAHCAAYKSDIARDILGRTYTNNAYCSCMVTPDEPHNNCVRDCLQDKMWTLLAYASRPRKPGDPPLDLDSACLIIWNHHRDCYRDCGCTRAFIDFLPFYAVCNIALPCALDSAAINLTNRCMPATKNDKYLPVD